jgi:hypothetical protein
MLKETRFHCIKNSRKARDERERNGMEEKGNNTMNHGSPAEILYILKILDIPLHPCSLMSKQNNAAAFLLTSC